MVEKVPKLIWWWFRKWRQNYSGTKMDMYRNWLPHGPERDRHRTWPNPKFFFSHRLCWSSLQHCYAMLLCTVISSDISVLKFISVSVSISFSLNHFYFYIISVLIWPIISVFISFYTNHFYFIIYQYCQKQSFQFQVVSTKLFFHIILQLQMVTAFISQH